MRTITTRCWLGMEQEHGSMSEALRHAADLLGLWAYPGERQVLQVSSSGLPRRLILRGVDGVDTLVHVEIQAMQNGMEVF
jgi:hypothetical protein